MPGGSSLTAYRPSFLSRRPVYGLDGADGQARAEHADDFRQRPPRRSRRSPAAFRRAIGAAHGHLHGNPGNQSDRAIALGGDVGRAWVQMLPEGMPARSSTIPFGQTNLASAGRAFNHQFAA